MTTFFTANPGKTKVKITAIQVLENHSHDICPPEAVPGSIRAIPCPFQLFKMIFNTFVICVCLGIARLIKAAKLAPRWNPQLAQVHQKELAKGNRNRATLAVARKLVAFMLAVDKNKRPFQLKEEAMAA
jgi:hypothetical protein